MNNKQVSLIGGFIALLLGGAAELFAVTTYMEDTSGWIPHYTYSAPFTGHEILVIVCAIFGLMFLIDAIILLVKGFTQQ